MNPIYQSGSSRREFLGRIVPACAVTCLGLGSLPLLGRQTQGQGQAGAPPAKHKFDEEFPRKLTFRNLINTQYGSTFIPLAVFLSEKLGLAEAVALLKEWATKQGEEGGRGIAQRLKSNDFAALKKFFDPTNASYKNTLTMEVVESTDRVHELKVTECLWADVFLKAKAGELGYASVCYGDYAFARAFNPQIEMVRDKTLMQGQPLCNHRYIWKG
jgi:hypothetical protein